MYAVGRVSCAYYTCHLGLIDVIADINRSPDGTADGFKSKGARRHELLFHPEILEKPGLPTILNTIEHQLD